MAVQSPSATTRRPAQVKDLCYQLRKKLGDIESDLPAGIVGPEFNDEFGDVYSLLFMLTADGASYRQLKDAAEESAQRAAARARRQQGRHLSARRTQTIFVEFGHAKLATLGITPQADFRQPARAERRDPGRLVRHRRGPHHPCASPARSTASRPSRRRRSRSTACLPPWRHRDRRRAATRTRRASSCARTASPRSASASSCRRARNIISLGEELEEAMAAHHRRAAASAST